MRFPSAFLLLNLFSTCFLYPVKAFEIQEAGFKESSHKWSSVLAEGPAGSAFVYSLDKQRLSKRQECLKKKGNRTLIGTAIGGVMGNRLSRGKRKNLGTFAGAAAGGSIGSLDADC